MQPGRSPSVGESNMKLLVRECKQVSYSLLLLLSSPPNKCTSSPAAVPRCTYCQPSYCLRTACAALTHTCLSFSLSSPVLCAKHWLFQGRRGHQVANKYTLTTGRNNYSCPPTSESKGHCSYPRTLSPGADCSY